MANELHEECGVFGIYTVDKTVDPAHETYLALYSLQHRGQESCGIAINDSGVITGHKDVGLVPDVMDEETLDQLSGANMAIGHVRYSTTGTNNQINAQPLVMKHAKGTLALAHNGNLINALELRKKLELSGAIFQTTNDTEVIGYYIARHRLKTGSIEKALIETMKIIKGAYSLVLMSPRKLIAARDPHGFRPLCIGKLGNNFVFASESCALDSIGATFVRDVEPGEVVVVYNGKLTSYKDNCGKKSSFCIFEYIYFARGDSIIDGQSVHEARRMAGKLLAIGHPVGADLVCGVPDSGIDSALGYSEQSGIPYGLGFVKNRYVGRTFIQPTQGQRSSSVKIKLNALKSVVSGKRIVMVDDSIVRGTTSAHIVQMLRDAGATEVHVRISSPPFKNPCFFGTDIDSRANLIACKMSLDEICKSIGADSLGYLSFEDLDKIAPDSTRHFCKGCFTGKYPIKVPDEIPKDRFEEKIKITTDND